MESVGGKVVGVFAHFQHHIAGADLAPLSNLRRLDDHHWIRLFVQCDASLVASLGIVREDIQRCFRGGIASQYAPSSSSRSLETSNRNIIRRRFLQRLNKIE